MDDARIGIKSTALTFGKKTRLALAATLAFRVAGLGYAGANAGLGLAYTAALVAYESRTKRINKN